MEKIDDVKNNSLAFIILVILIMVIGLLGYLYSITKENSDRILEEDQITDTTTLPF